MPHGDYNRYRMGERFEVTYAASAPLVHRIGRVDWLYALGRLAYWLLLLLNGGAYLFFPLWLLEFRRRPIYPVNAGVQVLGIQVFRHFHA